MQCISILESILMRVVTRIFVAVSCVSFAYLKRASRGHWYSLHA